MARRSVPAAPAGPAFLHRLLGTFVRWVAWCVVAAIAYAVVVLAIAVAVRHVVLPASQMVGLVVYNAGTTLVLASLVVAMVLVPYGFVVWGNSKIRFAAETTPYVTGALRAAVAGALVGLVLGVAWHR